jgi:hypothetical protein
VRPPTTPTPTPTRTTARPASPTKSPSDRDNTPTPSLPSTGSATASPSPSQPQSTYLPQGTPSDPPLPGPQEPGGSGPGSWPSTITDSLSLQRGLSAMLPILAGAVVIMALTLLLRPPRRSIG